MKTQSSSRGYLPHLYVDSSHIEGKGVFSKAFIEPGSYLSTYQGPQAKRNGKYVLWVTEECGAVEMRSGRNKLRFLNHSKEPNAYFDGFDLFASKSIEPGDEITFDYGDDPF